MSAETRQQVLDSARYLREVRPLEPSELAEYVTGGVHPAVVRQILREEAFELELLERSDGMFVPIPGGPLAPNFDGVTDLPEPYDRAIEDALLDVFGPGWATGDSGNRLRNRIREIKAAYYAGERVRYDQVTALAYALYHFPQTYSATQYVLDELGDDGRLHRASRVLDIGAGVGGPAMALVDYWLGRPGARENPPPGRIEYHAVEPGAGADILERLFETTGPNVRSTIVREPIEDHDPAGSFDVLLLANVLSELDTPIEILTRCLETLATNGTIVAMAPADLETATELRRLERTIVQETDAAIYAPITWLWPDRTPSDDCWSFDRYPEIDSPPTQRRLAEAAEDPAPYLNTTVKVTYSLLRGDGLRRHDITADRSEAIPLGDLDDVVTERVDAVAAKLSHDLRAAEETPAEDSGHPIFRVGDGSQESACYAVLVHPTTLNETLQGAGYGTVLKVENVLVLWNADESAYNLVVDEETVVDQLGRGSPRNR